MIGWDGTKKVESFLKENGIVRRERTPIAVMVYAVYLYLLGASLSRVADAIEGVCKRSRQAIDDWVQKMGSFLKERFFRLNGELPPVLVVDETRIQIGSKIYYLWVALDPVTGGIYHPALTDLRNVLLALSFFRSIRRRYGVYPSKVITDGGVWYSWALRRVGMDHEVLSGDVRSCVERWNETLKDRMRSFDLYHPCTKENCDVEHVMNWIFLFAFYYNHVRPHMSLGGKPPLGLMRRVDSNWRLYLDRIMGA